MDVVRDYDQDSLELLLAEYECHPPARLAKLLPELLKEPLMLELVLSATEAPAAWIRAAFPASPLLLPTALNGHYISLIVRLARVPLLPVLFERNTTRDLDAASKDMLAALAALVALADASFASEGGSGAAKDPIEDAEPAPFAKARQKQGSKKRAKRAAAASSKSALDPKPFEELGVDIPYSQLAAGEASVRILAVLKDRFMNMLACLKRPEYVAALQKAYLDSAKDAVLPTQQKVVQAVPEEQPVVDTVAADSFSTLETESIKPALSFDNAAALGPWHILISSRADRDLRKLQRGDANMFRIVLKKIKELSFGQFSDDNQKRLTGRDTAVPIFEAKMTSDTRLVYRVDVTSEYDSEDEHQVLSVYGIYSHKQLERGDFWTTVGLQLACSKGAEYRRRCIFRSSPANRNDKVYAPATFPLRSPRDDNDAHLDDHAISIPLEDQDELHELLDLEKFVVFSQALLNSIIADIDVTHPFETSSEEKRIIEHPHSCYVLGRSGTGKTTTMVFRMLGHERAWMMRKDTMRKPRQLFVTQSRMLAGKVEDYFRKLLNSLEISEYKPKKLQKYGHSGAVPRYFLPDADDNTFGPDLPRRFSQLKDEHFPLFTTFEKLSRLVEADVDASQQAASAQPGAISSVLARPPNVKRTLVTYQAFRSTYWPHFPEHLTQGLDSALVYSEIMGVVKGSEESLYNEKKYLDRETYENFSSRRQSTFASERARVYDIFSAYERRRIQEGHIDAADRAHAMIRALKNDKGIIGQRVNFLYVDEAQDNLLIDTMVLRMICSNPRGLFWAGDTAQTISVGSSFRFNDLRAFLHRVEEAHTSELSKVGASPAALETNPPTLFQLLVNYRSHGGIVSCAQAVISLLSKFWPNSIDNLGEERGIVAGAKPVFLSSWNGIIARPEQPLFGLDNIEFGARQCVIVRSEEAQTKLQRDARDVGIVLTVYESKGLEFDDVLLYNFFDDSTVSANQWRVVLNALSDGDRSLAAPCFDVLRHAGVCAELKSLYVAITRARKKLWIFDESDKAGPMKAVWASYDLIQTGAFDTGVPKFGIASTQDEWEEQAKTLLGHERYRQAQYCFERAHNDQMAAVANAYYLRACAYSKPSGVSKVLQQARAEACLVAGRAFEECASPFQSTGSEGLYFRLAGELFEEAGKAHFPKAAKCFENGGQYIHAAELYREVVNFDDAVRVIKTHRLSRDDDAARIMTAAKLFYFNREDYQKGCLLFDEPDEAVDYLELRGLDIAQAAVLEMMGRWSEAAEVHLREGRTLAAAEAYFQDSAPESAHRSAILARDVITTALWEQIAFGRDPNREDENVIQIGNLVSQLRARNLDADIADEIAFFETLLRKDLVALRKYAGAIRIRQRSGSERLAGKLLLALHIYFTKGRRAPQMDLPQLVTRLDMMLVYVRLLRDRMTDSAAMTDPVDEQLFGFRPHSERRLILLPGTYLHDEARSFLRLPPTADSILIMEDDLSAVYKGSLMKLIELRICELNGLHGEKLALDDPCLLSLEGNCTDSACPRTHVAQDKYTPTHYNQRIRAPVLALSVLAAVDGVIEHPIVVLQERIWSSKLYGLLRPVAPALGNCALLDLSHVLPPGSRAEVFHSWIRPHLNELRPGRANVFTSVMQCAWMCFTFKSGPGAAAIMYNAPIIKASNGLRMWDSDNAPLAFIHLLHAVQAPLALTGCFLHGVEFLVRILEHRVPVDMAVVCDFFEDILASLIISSHLGSVESTSSVILPWSWCLSALRHPLANRQFSLGHIMSLVRVGEQLIWAVRKPKQAITLRGKRLIDAPLLIRHIFIGRICNALCLLGYNFEPVRPRISAVMRALRPSPATTPFHRYSAAQDWSSLAKVARQSLMDSQVDRMLWLARHHGPRSSFPEVTNVVFTSFEDLSTRLWAIRPGGSVQTREPAISGLASPAGPPPTGPPSAEHLEPEVKEHLFLNQVDRPVQSAVENADDSEVANEEARGADAPEQLHAAASVIQRCFRRHSTGNNAGKDHLFYYRICVASLQTQPIPSGYYRKLFLGPLPHVLSSLHMAENQLLSIKTDLIKEVKIADSSAYEELDAHLTRVGVAHKRLKDFRGTLRPGSIFHLRSNVSALERTASEVHKFMQSLPAALGEKFDSCTIEEEMVLGWRGIVAKRLEPGDDTSTSAER